MILVKTLSHNKVYLKQRVGFQDSSCLLDVHMEDSYNAHIKGVILWEPLLILIVKLWTISIRPLVLIMMNMSIVVPMLSPHLLAPVVRI